jgi:hypothetical protein
MDILVPLAILITIGIVYCYQKLFLNGEEIAPETYSGEEKASAINALAISLLLTRDHLRYYQRRKQQSENERPGITSQRPNSYNNDNEEVGVGTGGGLMMNNHKNYNNNINNSNNEKVPTTGTIAVKRRSTTASADNRDNGKKTVDFEHTDIYPEPAQNKCNLTAVNYNRQPRRSQSSNSNIDDEPVLDEDLNDGEETVEEIRAERNLYRKVIYPLLKILSDDSSYHSDARHLKKVVDFMQPPSEDEKEEAENTGNRPRPYREMAMIDPEAPFPDEPEQLGGSETALNGNSKQSDYLLRLSRELIDEQEQREEEKKRRQDDAGLSKDSNSKANNTQDKMPFSFSPYNALKGGGKGGVYAGQYQRRASQTSEHNNNTNTGSGGSGMELTTTTMSMETRKDLIILNRPSAASSSASTASGKHSHYLIRGKENILKKLREMLFIFQQYSASVARSTAVAATSEGTTAPREKEREDIFHLTDSLLLIDETTLGNYHDDRLQYYQCLYELLLTHKVIIMNTNPMDNTEAQKMAYQVGGGMSRNGPLKDKVSYYSLQDLQERIHALT